MRKQLAMADQLDYNVIPYELQTGMEEARKIVVRRVSSGLLAFSSDRKVDLNRRKWNVP